MNKPLIPRHNPPPLRERGVSIVEVMVAMVAGLILMAGVGQVFTSSKQTYRIQDARARLQENARFAMDIMMRSLRDSGHMGCSNSLPLNSNLRAGATAYRYDYGYDTADPRLNTIIAAQGFEWNAGTATGGGRRNWSPRRDSNVAPGAFRYGSDILTVRGPLSAGTRLSADMANATADLTVVDSSAISQCDIVVVSNCQNADVVQITGINASTLLHAAISPCVKETSNKQPGNANPHTFSATYAAGADVLPYGTTSFFVRKNSNDEDTAEPALYRRVNGEDSEELVEGVESMQILYGVDNDALPAVAAGQLPARSQYPNYTPDFYVTAKDINDNVLDWRRVVSVRISLLMRTREDNLASTAQTFPFNGAEFPKANNPDRRLRQVFTTTISIRNRLP